MTEYLLVRLGDLLLLLSFAVPVGLGLCGARYWRGVLWGWGIFISAFLFRDMVAPDLALYFLGREAAARLSPEQPGLPGAVLCGCMPGLLFHPLGAGLRLLVTAVRRLGRR